MTITDTDVAVRTRRIEIVDEEGRTRIALDATGDTARIAIYNRAGVDAIDITVNDGDMPISYLQLEDAGWQTPGDDAPTSTSISCDGMSQHGPGRPLITLADLANRVAFLQAQLGAAIATLGAAGIPIPSPGAQA